MNRCLFAAVPGTVVLVIAMAGAGVAGGWKSQLHEDDFGGAHTGFAVVGSRERVFALRCVNGKAPALVFATREPWPDGADDSVGVMLVRVDGNPVVRQRATLKPHAIMVSGVRSNWVRVVVSGDHLFPLLVQIANAGKRVSVAFEFFGRIYEKTRFSAQDAKAAMQRIWHYCGSSRRQSKKPQL